MLSTENNESRRKGTLSASLRLKTRCSTIPEIRLTDWSTISTILEPVLQRNIKSNESFVLFKGIIALRLWFFTRSRVCQFNLRP